jgi:GNAT superfamily N-acetyltransferase
MYRRRGLARKLVERGLQIIRENGGTKAFLNVIDANLPACKLYEKLGFEHYSGDLDMQMTTGRVPTVPVLPSGYQLLSLDRFDWQSRYELEKRISPQNLLIYEPVEEDRFRHPPVMRLILPLILRAQGKQDQLFQILDPSGQKVARFGYSVPRKGQGISRLLLRLDPNCPDIAPYILQSMLHEIITLAPGSRIELTLPFWMEPAIQAAYDAGFEKRLAYHRMGIIL